MKSEPLEVAYLYDFYSAVLTEKQRDYFDYYYNNDLSLSEIAENEGITRQGVRDIIARAEAILRDLESKLHLVARFKNVSDHAETIAELSRRLISVNAERGGNGQIHRHAAAIMDLAAQMAEQSNWEEPHGL